MPAPATLVGDLRLAPEQAARLRRGSWLRGFLRPFGAAGSPVRPAAAAFTSLGLVGLVIGITFSNGAGLAGGAAYGPALERETTPTALATGATDVRANAEGVGTGVPIRPVSQSSGDAYALSSTKAPERTLLDDRAGFNTYRTAAPTSIAVGPVDKASQAQSGEDRVLAQFSTPPNPMIAGSLALLGDRAAPVRPAHREPPRPLSPERPRRYTSG